MEGQFVKKSGKKCHQAQNQVLIPVHGKGKNPVAAPWLNKTLILKTIRATEPRPCTQKQGYLPLFLDIYKHPGFLQAVFIGLL